MSRGLVNVSFEGPKLKTQLSFEECVYLFSDIQSDIHTKISELDELDEGTDSFIGKCKELSEYPAEVKKKHPECFQGNLLHIYSSTETFIKISLQQSTTYGKCHEKLKTKPNHKESVPLKEKTDEECKDEDEKCTSKVIPLAEGSQTIEGCGGELYKTENSRCHQLQGHSKFGGDENKENSQEFPSESVENSPLLNKLQPTIFVPSEGRNPSSKSHIIEESFSYVVPTLDNRNADRSYTYQSTIQGNNIIHSVTNDDRYIKGLDFNNFSSINISDTSVSTPQLDTSLSSFNNKNTFAFDGESDQNKFLPPVFYVFSTYTGSKRGDKGQPQKSLSHMQKPLTTGGHFPVEVSDSEQEASTAQEKLSNVHPHSQSHTDFPTVIANLDSEKQCPTADMHGTSNNATSQEKNLNYVSNLKDQLLSVEREVENGIYSLPPHADQDGIPIRTYIIIIVVILAILLLLLLLFKVMQKLCLKCISNFSIIIHFN
ncbi:PIR Superfamily Protein [Plasmodium ovale curtisi]|uniref:PIR Superfamily Protein n=1 Tax=Plasmodium ovale curtisi TaxID=864141 RepID=A0A1A8X0M2_PLAOA|nr:PIR Superfamily Protein [Plasmodium ovale curtisi]